MPQELKVVYHVEPDAAALARRAAQYFVEQAERAVAAHGRARIAISGGSTPKATFALLADPAQPWRARMPWSHLDLWWVDERCVPPDDPDSNYRMTREAMLDLVPLQPEQIHRRPPRRATSQICGILSAWKVPSCLASMSCNWEWVQMDTLRLFFPTLTPCPSWVAWPWPTMSRTRTLGGLRSPGR
jgi:hypothetical protein